MSTPFFTPTSSSSSKLALDVFVCHTDICSRWKISWLRSGCVRAAEQETIAEETGDDRRRRQWRKKRNAWRGVMHVCMAASIDRRATNLCRRHAGRRIVSNWAIYSRIQAAALAVERHLMSDIPSFNGNTINSATAFVVCCPAYSLFIRRTIAQTSHPGADVRRTPYFII